jgi:glycosyltransferase involved in cell wall biosynthesis
MNILLIFRKKDPRFYSIENVFKHVLNRWRTENKPEVLVLPKAGVSISNFLFIISRIKKREDTIFHITGDVHYVTLLLPSNKTILTVHDCGFIDTYSGLKKWVLKKLLLNWPVRHLNYITTISEKTKQEIIRYTKCQPEKIIVIPNPVSNIFNSTEKTFNKETPQILFIGSTPNKNLERVITALRNISCSLRIIGKISTEQRKLLTENAIDFFDTYGISEQQLNEEYRKTDMVIFPSLYEGFGLPVIEAQKTGRVVIASNIAPMDDVAGGAACLVDPYSVESIREGVLKVIHDDIYRNDLIQKGFKNVERFSAEKIANQYLDLYNKIASKN